MHVVIVPLIRIRRRRTDFLRPEALTKFHTVVSSNSYPAPIIVSGYIFSPYHFQLLKYDLVVEKFEIDFFFSVSRKNTVNTIRLPLFDSFCLFLLHHESTILCKFVLSPLPSPLFPPSPPPSFSPSFLPSSLPSSLPRSLLLSLFPSLSSSLPPSTLCTYLVGEILEWTGFAIACWSLPALAFAIYTFSNLAPRAHKVK